MAPLLVREPSPACLIGAARAAFDGTTKGVKTEHRRLGKRETEMSGQGYFRASFRTQTPGLQNDGALDADVVSCFHIPRGSR